MTRKLSFLMAFILLFGIIFGVSPTLAASVNPRSAEGFEAYFLPYGRVDAILLGYDGEWAFVDAMSLT